MKPRISRFQPRKAFTSLDLLIVLITLALFAVLGLLLPGLARGRCSNCRPSCVNNLRQIGIAVRLWSNDNGDKFLWNVTNITESLLEPYAYCLLATNELNSPKILVCPADQGRTRAAVFDQTFSNNNLSYFLGLDADQTKPNSLLSGDRNLSTNKTILSGLITVQNSKQVNWAPRIHEEGGNIGLADGSAQQVSAKSIRFMMDDGKIQIPTRLLIP